MQLNIIVNSLKCVNSGETVTRYKTVLSVFIEIKQ